MSLRPTNNALKGTMNSKDYQASVLSTEAKPETLHAPGYAIYELLELIAATSDVTDLMKKVIFYGRAPDFAKLHLAAVAAKNAACTVLATMKDASKEGNWDPILSKDDSEFSPGLVNKRLLHAALGISGEAGELIKALQAQGLGQGLDVTNFVEELGDAGWYPPIAYDELGIPEEAVRVANVAKLTFVRYRKGFSGGAAELRNLPDERWVIEFVLNEYTDGKRPSPEMVLDRLDKALQDRAAQKAPTAEAVPA